MCNHQLEARYFWLLHVLKLQEGEEDLALVVVNDIVGPIWSVMMPYSTILLE